MDTWKVRQVSKKSVAGLHLDTENRLAPKGNHQRVVAAAVQLDQICGRTCSSELAGTPFQHSTPHLERKLSPLHQSNKQSGNRAAQIKRKFLISFFMPLRRRTLHASSSPGAGAMS